MGKRPQQKNVFDAVDKPRDVGPCTRLMRKENVLLDTQQPTSPTSDQRSPVDQARQTQSDATLQQKRCTHRPMQYTCNNFSSVLAAMSFVQSMVIPPSPPVLVVLICTFARRIDNNQTTLQTTRSSPPRHDDDDKRCLTPHGNSRSTQRAYLVNTVPWTTLSFSSLQRRNGTAQIRR